MTPIYYLFKIIKQGQIMKSASISSEHFSNSFEYLLEVTNEMQPGFVIIASYFSNGELIFDHYSITVNFHLPNKVNNFLMKFYLNLIYDLQIYISPSHSLRKPGDYIRIFIRAFEPFSFIGLNTLEQNKLQAYKKQDFISTKVIFLNKYFCTSLQAKSGQKM